MSKEAVRKPQLAGLVKAVIQNQNQLDPWLEFPQSSCCFKFGEAKRPLPIGALYLLWERDKRWSKPCRYCQGDARGLSCGGFLSTGWFEFICLDCSAFFVEHSGGLGTARDLLKSLIDTEFEVKGSIFGGAHASNGAALLEKLNLPYSSAEEVRFGIRGTR